MGEAVYEQYDPKTVPDRSLPLHKRVYRILIAAGKEFGADKGTRLGAALSYYTLFSLVPLLFLTVALIGFVSAESSLTGTDCGAVSVSTIPADPPNPLDRVLLQVEELAGRDVADQLANLTCQAGESRQQALWIGIALAAFSGSSIFLHLQGVLNQLFHVPEERLGGITSMLVHRGVALAWSLMLALVVFTPIAAVAGVNFVRRLIPTQWVRSLLSVVVPLTSLFVLVAVVALTFRVLTRATIPWQAARRGGLFTALTGLAGAFLVGVYLSRFGAGGALGAVGGAAILLFFFNLMWTIYVFGAEVTKVYADYLAYGDVLPPSERARPLSVSPDEVSEAGGTDRKDGAQKESLWRGGMVAFIVGLVTGWAARRRDS